jgi:hypothetical protein
MGTHCVGLWRGIGEEREIKMAVIYLNLGE